jgi:methyl-accepting chemotaxis protein
VQETHTLDENMTGSTTNQGISFFRSVKGQIFILFLALSITPLVISGAIIFFQSHKIIQEEIENGFTTLGNLQSMEITNWISERRKDTLTLAGIARIQSMDAETACPAVEQYFKQWAIYQDIFLIRPDGTRLCDSSGNTASAAKSSYFQKAMQGDFIVSDPFIEESSRIPVIVTAAPIEKDGQILGVIALSIPTDFLSKLLNTEQSGDSREAYIIGEKGFFITRDSYVDDSIGGGRIKNNEHSELELRSNTLGVKQALSGKSGMEEYPGYDGKAVLGVYRPLPSLGSGAALLLEENLDAVQQKSNGLRNTVILIGLLSASVVVGLAILFGKKLTEPLVFISGKLNSLAMGNLEQDSSQKVNRQLKLRRDEYGMMSQALENVTNYMVFVSETASQIARGDLTSSVIVRSEKDEIGMALQLMITGLRSLIGGVKRNALDLERASGHLDESANQAGRATSQISTTIQQVALGINQQAESVSKTAVSASQMNKAIDHVASGAREQAQAVDQASRITDKITGSIQQVTASARASAQGAVRAGETARHGAETVKETIKSMQSIKARVGQSSEKVQEMGHRSGEIGAIIETIDEIASQTNLLALNAAIEAARAGEQGKGFAVVADEVRKLAERSRSATREIGSLIHGIQGTVSEAVSAMDAGGKEVENGVLCANQSGEALDGILSAVEVVNGQVKEITSAAQEIDHASGELVSAMKTVSVVVQENINATKDMLESSAVVSQSIEAFASVSEENSAAVEEVSAGTEEMNAQVDDMSSSAGSLAQLAQKLQDAVFLFKTDG